jgi:predicted dehydrogenase
MNAKEVKEIIDAAKAAKKKVLFNFNNRARPESQAMMKYITDGTVGKINSAQAKWIRRTGIPGFGGWFTTEGALRRRSAHRPPAHDRPRHVFHGLSRARSRARPDLLRFHHRQAVQRPLGHP